MIAARAAKTPQGYLIDWTIWRIVLHEQVGRGVSAPVIRQSWSFREITEALVLCDELDAQIEASKTR